MTKAQTKKYPTRTVLEILTVRTTEDRNHRAHGPISNPVNQEHYTLKAQSNGGARVADYIENDEKIANARRIRQRIQTRRQPSSGPMLSNKRRVNHQEPASCTPETRPQIMAEGGTPLTEAAPRNIG